MTYTRAVRGRFAPLLMLSGPSGTGKTYSALRLAKGMAGRDGKIFVADTDNSRAKLYAEEFDFMHLDLREPFRPMLFENAAKAAQAQHASVLVVDNFAAEWNGPGGVLEWHEEELSRMAGDDQARRESLKMVAWGRVKPPHKHMYQRLYQLNMAIILCCSAERKIAMIKQTEGKSKGKVIPVDQGFQPIGDKDAAYAMTVSLLLQDVHHPGTAIPIKALLPALRPIIHLDRPLDEETGRRIAAWARGEKEPVPGERTGSEVREETTATSGNAVPQEPSPSMPPPDDSGEGQVGDTTMPPPDPPPAEDSEPTSSTAKRKPTEEEIEEGAKVLGAKFLGAADRKEYLAIVDNADNRKQMNWLKRNRHELWEREVDKAQKASWTRTDQKNQQQGGLV